MHTEIKICGLSTREAVSASIDAGADLLGFIFFEKSPRHISLETASELSHHNNKRAKITAVTVNADEGTLDEIVSSARPDFLQLHGSETPEDALRIKDKYQLPVIKAFAIRESNDFGKLKHYEGVVDRFLLDAKAPEGSVLPGGNGVSFDWTLLSKLKTPVPYMLSGGLNPENILQALNISKATSIDISSGVETAPGVKDIAKIAAFIKTVREYDANRQTLAEAIS